MGKVQSERGAAAVEFALIVPLLIVLVLGIVEFGRAFQVQATLAAAAREGARVVALESDPVKAEADGIEATQNAGESLALAPEDIDPTTCTGTDPSANAAVKITYTHPSLTGFFSAGFELSATGVMRCKG